MSYAEHGPRIFLVGRPSCGAPLTYGDYVLPKKRLEGRLKLYNSCTDIRAWSPNISESSRYFRELNEHDPAVCFSYKFLAIRIIIYLEKYLFKIFTHRLQVFKVFLHEQSWSPDRLWKKVTERVIFMLVRYCIILTFLSASLLN